jgi:hypothetical protein
MVAIAAPAPQSRSPRPTRWSGRMEKILEGAELVSDDYATTSESGTIPGEPEFHTEEADAAEEAEGAEEAEVGGETELEEETEDSQQPSAKRQKTEVADRWWWTDETGYDGGPSSSCDASSSSSSSSSSPGRVSVLGAGAGPTIPVDANAASSQIG